MDIPESPIVTELKQANARAARGAQSDDAVDPAADGVVDSNQILGFVGETDGELTQVYLSRGPHPLAEANYLRIRNEDIVYFDQLDYLGPARIWVRRGATLELGGPNALEAALSGELFEKPPGIMAIYTQAPRHP